MIREIAKRKIPILLTGMRAPPNLGPEYEAEFNGLYRRLARRHKILLYPFFLEGIAAIPSLNQADAIHPNAEGVAEIVNRIRPMILQLIDEMR
jgi:acyl-CoA thioesterase-1